jgi:hypothetical protein
MYRTERAKLAACPAPITQDFYKTQIALAHFNRQRLQPLLDDPDWREKQADNQCLAEQEEEFIEQTRADVAPLMNDIPSTPTTFVAWFEDLRSRGPGQGDPLFPWLANQASREEMRWFLTQEVAGEAGFDDLVALTQIRMPLQAKLEMARNYWDEMGRGTAKGMHGPMLGRLAQSLELKPTPETTVPEALALSNLMVALAYNRRYAFQSIGALGAIEMTAPTRVGFVNEGLRRLGVGARDRHYFALHATLDVRHSQAWNREVLASLVADDKHRARPIAEGALMRLLCGQRCFERYRAHLNLPRAATTAPRTVQ